MGGENAPDTVRGPYNEGGWWFERVGKYFPRGPTERSFTPAQVLTCRGLMRLHGTTRAALCKEDPLQE